MRGRVEVKAELLTNNLNLGELMLKWQNLLLLLKRLMTDLARIIRQKILCKFLQLEKRMNKLMSVLTGLSGFNVSVMELSRRRHGRKDNCDVQVCMGKLKTKGEKSCQNAHLFHFLIHEQQKIPNIIISAFYILNVGMLAKLSVI